jgi:hypothetical protein
MRCCKGLPPTLMRSSCVSATCELARIAPAPRKIDAAAVNFRGGNRELNQCGERGHDVDGLDGQRLFEP